MRALVFWLTLGGVAHAASTDELVQEFEQWRFDEVAAELRAHPPSDPAEREGLQGLVDYYAGRYVDASAHLEHASHERLSPRLAEEVAENLPLSQAAAELTAKYLQAKSPSGHFVLSYPPGKDELLVPYLLATLDAAYEALGADLGEKPATPVRVELLGKPTDLAKLSPLTEKDIETSGTIALCKYNKLMVVSPRATFLGYPWLDTVTHEYTHFVLSLVSRNTVPLWMQEGVAKFEEIRWRPAAKYHITPLLEHLLARALANGKFVTFAEMYPSMAKLPSQELAALAFAEVYTMVQYLHAKIGWAGLREIIGRLTTGASLDATLSQSIGQDLEQLQASWMTWLKQQHLHAHNGLVPTKLRFRNNTENQKDDNDNELIKEDKAKKFARLGNLLRNHNLPAAAILEYEKARTIAGPENPELSPRLAKMYLDQNQPEKAVKEVTPSLELYPDMEGPHATLGQALFVLNRFDDAEPELLRAIAIMPFDPQPHCTLAKIYMGRADRASQLAVENAACAQLQ
jgi:tetratricopeptide (TPR) repeat protein